MTIISQVIDMIGDDLQGHPLHIQRPGKEDFVLVSAETYSNLIAQIRELEGRDKHSGDDEEELLRLLGEAAEVIGAKKH
ncbi:hypothetical protein Q4543_20310 [Salipiger sp. 1_MG-2023]|uniref:hypothetical protein n=1 Tax=Salipiger sp. 1_MG-2023 TaxID=3062665 RepID=UPI0026E3D63A|nr:hypothetical protein [Salipiger sp. 1_MG-2023]MDO6587860.1 hypothetical protein [Salipiger sp. 1_MG-2023]